MSKLRPVEDPELLKALNGGAKPVEDERTLMLLEGVPEDIAESLTARPANEYIDDVTRAREAWQKGQPIADVAAAMPKGAATVAPLPSDGDAPPDDGRKKTWDGYGRALFGQAAQGLTLGYFDEGLAGIASLLGSDYDRSLAGIRAADKEAQTDYPVTSFAANVAGSLLPAAGAARLVSGAGQATRALRGVQGAGAGLGFGAVQGFGSGEGGASERAKSAAVGGVVGGVAGGAAPWVEDAISAVASPVINAATGARAAKSGMSPDTMKVVERTMSADDALSPSGVARILSAGPDAMPVDSGQSARGLLDWAVQSGGPGGRIASDAVENRAAAQSSKLSAALDGALGPNVGAETAMAANRTGTAAARKSAYDAAYAVPIDYSGDAGKRLEALLSRIPKSAMTEAADLMRLRGEGPSQMMASFADDGSVAFTKMPDVRELDYITRALNEVARSADTKGAMGGQTAYGGALRDLSEEIRGTVKGLVPEYDVALQTAADPIRNNQAIKLGQDLMSKAWTQDEVRQAAQRMTAPEKQAAATGVREHIAEIVDNVKAAASDPNLDARQAWEAAKQLSSKASREKIETIVGAQRASVLFDSLDQAVKAFELRAGVARGSQTFGRLEADRVVSQLTDDSVWQKGVSGNIAGMGRAGVGKLFGMTPEIALKNKDRVGQELARFLTSRRGPDAAKAVEEIAALIAKRGANSSVARGVAKYLTRPAVPAAVVAADRANQGNARAK
jgi:hypothetical protein